MGGGGVGFSVCGLYRLNHGHCLRTRRFFHPLWWTLLGMSAPMTPLRQKVSTILQRDPDQILLVLGLSREHGNMLYRDYTVIMFPCSALRTSTTKCPQEHKLSKNRNQELHPQASPQELPDTLDSYKSYVGSKPK